MAYAAWRSRDGHRFALPDSAEWEKAARGVDERIFSWGEDFVGTYCNFKGSFRDGMRPVPVDSFPEDESPYGVRGLSGNVKEATLGWFRVHPDYRIWHGGGWPATDLMSRAATRVYFPKEVVLFYAGGRLSWPSKLPLPGTQEIP
jgi:serine/threonine-protein kinase